MIELFAPCVITSRLCAGLHVRDSAGLCELSIERAPVMGERRDGKPVWRWHIDLPNGEHHTGDDLAGWGDERSMLGSLCAFLSNDGERYSAAMRQGQELDGDDYSFGAVVAEWAYSCSDELGMLSMELEEGVE